MLRIRGVFSTTLIFRQQPPAKGRVFLPLRDLEYPSMIQLIKRIL